MKGIIDPMATFDEAALEACGVNFIMSLTESSLDEQVWLMQQLYTAWLQQAKAHGFPVEILRTVHEQYFVNHADIKTILATP